MFRYKLIVPEQKPKIQARLIPRIIKRPMDVFTKKKRSEIMSKIHSKNTKVEVFIFRELRKRKIYFQKHYKKVSGAPDIAIPSKKIAVFVDGDFWHGRNFPAIKKRLPKKYWQDKIRSNIIRDRKQRSALRRSGWKVLSIWEHQIKKDPVATINRIAGFLKK